MEADMKIPVRIEPVAGNGYRARTGEPFAFTAEGATREEALERLRELIRRLPDGAEVTGVEIPVPNPWVEFAGMFKDDPYFDEWQAAIAENRRKADEDLDLP
jgi:predicted RNase H-like HicB family nuclease